MADTMRIELDPDAIRRHLSDDSTIRERIEEGMDRALAYWRENARHDTGYMADAAYGVVVTDSEGEMEGYLEFPAPYTRYQEDGTRYIRGMHLTQEMLRLMAEGS